MFKYAADVKYNVSIWQNRSVPVDIGSAFETGLWSV